MGIVLTPLSFAVFGLLMSRQMHSPSVTIVGAVLGLLFGLLVLVTVAGTLAAGHAALRSQPALILRSLSDGAALLLPFALLALVAEFGLHWNAGQVFASAGLMASVSACGAAAGKHSGKAGAWGTILPLLGGGVLMLLWMGAGMLPGMMGGR